MQTQIKGKRTNYIYIRKLGFITRNISTDKDGDFHDYPKVDTAGRCNNYKHAQCLSFKIHETKTQKIKRKIKEIDIYR